MFLRSNVDLFFCFHRIMILSTFVVNSMSVCFFYPFFCPCRKKLILLKGVPSCFFFSWNIHLTSCGQRGLFFLLFRPFCLCSEDCGGHWKDGGRAVFSPIPSTICVCVLPTMSALVLHGGILQCPCVHSILAV